MGSETADLKAKYTEILKSNDIQDEISEVTVTKPDLRGMHMASIIEVAKIEFTTGRDPLQLFVKKKLQIPDPVMNKGMTEIMIGEATFLTEIVKAINDFRKERKGGPDVSDLFPKVYYYDEDMIIMEDLTERGYITMPKAVKRSWEETKNVFEHLARLHSITHVMIAEAGGPEKFLELYPTLEDMMKKPGMGEVMSQSFDVPFEYCMSLINASNYPDKQEKFDLLDKYRGKFHNIMMETIDAETLVWAVDHGDCWNNNMMINADTKNLVLVDFQIPRINSPNMDLIRFLFFSSSHDVRLRWKELLQYYFEVLKEYVLALGHPFSFKFEDFVQDFRRKGKLDFVMGLLVIMGFEAIEKHDTEDTTGDFKGDFQNLLTSWAEKNPERLGEIGDRTVEMINDYLLFGEL